MEAETEVKALGMSYEFRGGKMIFSDGVEYSINEAATMARDRLTDDDIRAIHLVKKLFDGEIVDVEGSAQRAVFSSRCVGEAGGRARSLDDIAKEMEDIQ